MLPYQTISQKDNGIAIIGIGGAGANVLQCFGTSSADHVRLYTMSLDERVGRACGNVEFIQLGEVLSHGLGSGGDPDVGRRAMEESAAKVREILADSKLLVMVVGLGGGTGSGAAPVLAQMAREAGLFLVSVIMMPFTFEGKRRREQAEKAHEEIARLSDIVFCFENDYMEELFRDRSGARQVFEEVDRLLAKATASVPMMATSPGLINLGLDELATALENHDSRCIFGSGSSYGANRAEQAARAAVESPLASYHGALRYARSVIVHIAGGESMSLTEIREAMDIIRDSLAGEDVELFFGATVKSHLGDEMRITLIASIDAEEFKTALMNEAAAAPPEPEPEPEEEPATEPDQPEPEQDEPAVEDEDAELYTEEVEEIPAPQPQPEEPEEEPYEDEDEDSEEDTEPAPAPIEEEEEEEEPEPIPTPTPAPQQLDLFSASPMRPAENADRFPTATPRRAETAATQAPYTNAPTSDYSPEAARMRLNPTDSMDDLDTPPSMRYNDLRDIFPDN